MQELGTFPWELWFAKFRSGACAYGLSLGVFGLAGGASFWMLWEPARPPSLTALVTHCVKVRLRAAATLGFALAGIPGLCWLYAGPRLLLRLELKEFNLGER